MIETDILNTLEKAKEVVEKVIANDGAICSMYGFSWDVEMEKIKLECLSDDLSDSIDYLTNQWARTIALEEFRKATLQIAQERNGKSTTNN